jgi:hypothetical protein
MPKILTESARSSETSRTATSLKWNNIGCFYFFLGFQDLVGETDAEPGFSPLETISRDGAGSRVYASGKLVACNVREVKQLLSA